MLQDWIKGNVTDTKHKTQYRYCSYTVDSGLELDKGLNGPSGRFVLETCWHTIWFHSGIYNTVQYIQYVLPTTAQSWYRLFKQHDTQHCSVFVEQFTWSLNITLIWFLLLSPAKMTDGTYYCIVTACVKYCRTHTRPLLRNVGTVHFMTLQMTNGNTKLCTPWHSAPLAVQAAFGIGQSDPSSQRPQSSPRRTSWMDPAQSHHLWCWTWRHWVEPQVNEPQSPLCSHSHWALALLWLEALPGDAVCRRS